MHNFFLYFFIVVAQSSFTVDTSVDDGFCPINNIENCKDQNSIMHQTRYLLYDVNPPEGFNLRRDVYIRMAVFTHILKNSNNKNLSNFKLVLPPWNKLYHWNRKEQDEHIPWSHFFDLDSLRRFAPVIEMHQFFDEMPVETNKVHIDQVYVLQHFEDMFETGNFEDRMSTTECKPNIDVHFYHYDNITSDDTKCLSFHGHTSQLKDLLLQSKARTIFFDHAEIPLHDQYGRPLYWQARRSMRFSKFLRNIANRFRNQYLNSTDATDNSFLPDNWLNEKLKRDAVGGPYLSVHLRRRDFVWGRPKQVPTIPGAIKQIKKLVSKLKLNAVFVATDATLNEWRQLKEALSKDGIQVFRFDNSDSLDLGDGQLAIIDQIICSYARYFVGTHESTFSFRIQEEREIIGFPVDTTFNRLCGDDEQPCEEPSKWTIVH